MIRRLSEADKEIWDRLRRTVKPLRKRKEAKPVDPREPPSPATCVEAPKTAKAKREKERAPAHPAAVKPKTPAPLALALLEEKTRRRLERGRVEIDSRIDLHGMQQERAHHALVAFLGRAQAEGHRIVLVVTGKGRSGEQGRGVLRQAVPGWLARPDLRALVVGFEAAGRRHGGEGALYIRIRRRRAARSPASPRR